MCVLTITIMESIISCNPTSPSTRISFYLCIRFNKSKCRNFASIFTTWSRCRSWFWCWLKRIAICFHLSNCLSSYLTISFSLTKECSLHFLSILKCIISVYTISLTTLFKEFTICIPIQIILKFSNLSTFITLFKIFLNYRIFTSIRCLFRWCRCWVWI